MSATTPELPRVAPVSDPAAPVSEPTAPAGKPVTPGGGPAVPATDHTAPWLEPELAAATTARRGRPAAGRDLGMVVSDLGRRDAEVVVLVHGIGVSERYFRPLARELAVDRRVLVPDLPGFGRSPRPDHAPSIAELARAVRQLLEQRGVERAVLVGHSMGAQVVAEAMHQAPGTVTRGILIGTVIDPSAPGVLRQGLRLLRDGLYEPPSVNAVIVTDYLRAGPRWYSAMLPRMLAYDTEAAVRQVPGELVLARGERDPVSSRGWLHHLAEVAPRGTAAEVPGAGHVAMHTHPGVVAQWVRHGAGTRPGAAR